MTSWVDEQIRQGKPLPPSSFPYGIEASNPRKREAWDALTRLVGDPKTAAGLGMDIREECGGYFPDAATIVVKRLAKWFSDPGDALDNWSEGEDG